MKALKLYLTGIKSYQLDLGIDCSAFSDARLERTIQGIKRDHYEPERQTRTPLTRPKLLRIPSHLTSRDYDCITLRAAFTLAFAGFLTVGEFTYREADTHLGTLFHKWFITKASIKISDNSTYMESTLPASKRDPFRKWIKLTIAATQDEGCPGEGMKRFQERDTH